MDEFNQSLPPSYSLVQREDAAAVAATYAAADTTQDHIHQERCSRGGRHNNRHNTRSESRRLRNNNNINHHSVRDERRQNTENHHPTVPEVRQDAVVNIGRVNISNSFSGLIDILHRKEKLPCGCAKVTLYKLGLLVYYCANFIYSIVAAAIQRENFVFYLVYVIISVIGLINKIFVMIFHVKKHCTLSNDTEEETTLLDSTNEGTRINDVQENNNAFAHIQNYPNKAKIILKDYIFLSLGEFLIHPTLICTLYGFINKRAWRLDDWISGCNSFFFLYSVIMEAIYVKSYLVYFVIRISRASYKKYDELMPPMEMEWKRYFTPVYLTILLAFLTALTHWLMIGIVGVRIYIDNFTPKKDDTNSSIPNTGDYNVVPFTWWILTCTIYLPIVSWVTYIILNKLWFREIFSAINQLTMGANRMPARHPWNDKLFAFIKDPSAYIAVVFLMVPFIAFIAGAYLLDYKFLHYELLDYEVSSSARHSIRVLGLLYVISFVLSNLQAAIIFLVGIAMLIAIILCGLPILCGVLCYKICCKDQVVMI